MLGGRKAPRAPEVAAEAGVVVAEPGSGFCGAVVRVEPGTARHDAVVLEDRHGRRRVFPMAPSGFRIDGRPVTLVRPVVAAPSGPRMSASGSRRVEGLTARTAAASRIWVEGVHDAELVEVVWGHDLRVEGVVVEPLDGVDVLAERVAGFGPGPGRRLGVLVDHLVAGSTEARVADRVAGPHVLVTGHPFVDIWQAVKPAAVGIAAWPVVPRGVPWKEGVCAALGWGDPVDGWRRVRSAVSGFRDLEAPLVGAVERLIDFVTEQ